MRNSEEAKIQYNRAVRRLLTVMNELAASGPLGVGELARRLGVSKSYISRLLGTLGEAGVVSRHEESGLFDLGPRVAVWGGAYLSRHKLSDIALPVMRRLGERVGETVELHILAQNYRVCIQRVHGTYGVGKIGPLGTPLPLHCGAAGKVLIAYLSPEDRRALLGSSPLVAYTEHTIVDLDQLEADLARIRQDGYAVSIGEREPGAFSVVAPVFNHTGTVVASLSLAGPTSRLDDETVTRYVAEVRKAAWEISESLGAVKPDVAGRS